MNKKIIWIITFIVSILILILVGIPKTKTKVVHSWPTVEQQMINLQKKTQEINKEVSWVEITLKSVKSKVIKLRKQCNQVKSWLQKTFNMVSKPEIKSCAELKKYEKDFHITKKNTINKNNKEIINY